MLFLRRDAVVTAVNAGTRVMPWISKVSTLYSSSEIPATVPFPASPKTALWQEFLRFPAKAGGRFRGGPMLGRDQIPAFALLKTYLAYPGQA